MIIEGKASKLDSYNPEITLKNQKNHNTAKVNIHNVEMKFDRKKKRNKGYAFF